LRFVIHEKETGDCRFGFTLELNGVKTWIVPEVPSMNPLDQRLAKEDQIQEEHITAVERSSSTTWDKGNYIPIDDEGNILDENQAIDCLEEGVLKFFLQGKKLVGEFVLMKKSSRSWLLMKRHDEFASYNKEYTLEAIL
jgi:bifunctional non-homologous end joining protein LigD